MPDLRALILDRIEEVLATVPDAPALAVHRNRGDFGALDKPCMVLLDGREVMHQNFEGKSGRVYARTAPSIMILYPQIFALLKRREPARAHEYKGEITAYRNGIIKTILSDSELADYAGENGDIAYRGHETDMQSGSTMEGTSRLDFAFYYVLKPNEL